MFLDESYNYNSGVSADPMYGAKLIQEASDEWNDLCMKMIKLEHTAIVQEDAGLLQEGIKEFGKSVADHAKYAGQKFLEYLEEVRIQWSKIQASIATKICNPTMVQTLLNKVNDNKLGKISTNFSREKLNLAIDIIKDISNLRTDLDNLTNYKFMDGKDITAKEIGNHISDRSKKYINKSNLQKIVDKMQDIPVNDTPIQVTRTDVQAAINFLKNRPIAIKNIELMKKYVKIAINETIKNAKSDTKLKKKNIVVAVQRYCNSIILSINSGTSVAIKVCNAVKQKTVASNKQYKDARKLARQGHNNYVATKNVSKITSESVLDLFD